MLDSLWARLGGWARRAAAAALGGGGRPVPRHVAFIMDGNRRYAEARSLRKVDGHAYGYTRLIDALEWCLDLGVTCVSVYAFSIDNYRRSGEEVETLMALARDKLAHMLQESAVLEKHGVQVRVIGDLSLAPQAVQDAAAAVMRATAHHDRAILNLCFSYTASEELLRAIDATAAASALPQAGSSLAAPPSAAAAAVATGSASSSSTVLSSSSLPSAADLERHFYTAGCPPVDLLVRTSGETRLSDFLLWQCRFAVLVFTPVLWPDFGFLDLIAAVLQFQKHAAHVRQLRAAAQRQASPSAAQAAAAAAAAAAQAEQQSQAAAAAAPMPPLASAQAAPCLQAVKVGAGSERRQLHGGSPCSVASPASPSSPSSRSEGSAEESAAALALAAGEAAGQPAGAASLPLRKRSVVSPAGALL